MATAFRAFMEGLIDYAGLFPPARLDLDTAIRNFIRYLDGAEAWMLKRFIIPAARLKELVPYQGELFSGRREPIRFSILLSGEAGPNGVSADLHHEIEELIAFQERQGRFCATEVLETRLPRETAEAAEAEQTTEYLRSLDALLERTGLRGMELFVEVPPESLSIRTVESAIQGIADLGKTGASGNSGVLRAGIKLRCGGLEPRAFPRPDLVARVLLDCRDLGVPLKCTAGLHHPVRHRDEDVDVMAHGFFNLFGAGILAYGQNIPFERVAECLCDKEALSFRFQEDLFAWRETGVPAAVVAEARAQFIIGFGSCSFDEPREDLRGLGLL
jgi:hypothetical protein